MQMKAEIYCDRHFTKGNIDKRLFGSFVEHMGRVVYSGIYEPENSLSDEDGFRKDVLEAVKNMGVTCVRYPGGNFVSNYFWEDGIGPKEKRPHRPELAWSAIETNEFGTDEFIEWSKKAGTEPVFTVNLGTRGVEDALNYLEYCNFQSGTEYSDLRKSYGHPKPYGIRTWCLGNEMDGEWQIGHKSAEDYGKLAYVTGAAMKRLDPSIELVVCGSSLSTMPTFPDWDYTVMEETYGVADYIALHQYYGGQEKGVPFFLAQSEDMQTYIDTVRAAASYVKTKTGSKKDLKFSVDEWGVWAVPSDSVNQETKKNPYQIAPAISEQVYTMEDTLLFAEMFMVILRNSDVIIIACQSLLTNISSCIMTERGGGLWLQPIYYVFRDFALYGKGKVLLNDVNCPGYDAGDLHNISSLNTLEVWNQQDNEIIIYSVNRTDEDIDAAYELSGFTVGKIAQAEELRCDDLLATNQNDHSRILPHEKNNVNLDDHGVTAVIPAYSFNMIRLSLD